MPGTLRQWLAAELEKTFALPPAEADDIASALTTPRSPDAHPSLVVVPASKLVALCRLTVRFPDVRAWWSTESGRRAFADLRAKKYQEAWYQVNEIYVAPADDAIDPNWPDYKIWPNIGLAPDKRAGARFVAGGSSGERYVMKVVAAPDGSLRTELVYGIDLPFTSWLEQAESEAWSFFPDLPD